MQQNLKTEWKVSTILYRTKYSISITYRLLSYTLLNCISTGTNFQHYTYIIGLKSGLRPSFSHRSYSTSVSMLSVQVSGGTNSLTSTPNDRFLNKFFMGILFIYFFFFQSFCQKSAYRKSPKKYFCFSYFVLVPDLGYEPGL